MLKNPFKKNAFGLDISDTSIEIVLLDGSIENPQILAIGRTALEAGIVEDGRIINKEKLINALDNLIKNPKFGKINTRKIIFTLPESRIFLDIFELPKNPKKEKQIELIQSRMSKTFPYSPKELYYDFLIKDRNEVNEIFLVAAPKDIVNDYLEIFNFLKLQPLVFDIESESLSRSLIGKEKGTILIIDIGARTISFSVFDGDELKLSISNETAGNRFTQSIAEKLKIPIEKAEQIKRESGLNPEFEEGKIFLIIQKDIQMGIVLETRKIEKYFQEKEGKKIEKIIIAGGSSLLPCLREYLADNLDKKVAIGNPWVKINTGDLKEKEIFETNPIFYATVVGSALRSLVRSPTRIGINLIKNTGRGQYLLKRKFSFIQNFLAKIKGRK
jgi:type IV pilus assembly protein PilM